MSQVGLRAASLTLPAVGLGVGVGVAGDGGRVGGGGGVLDVGEELRVAVVLQPSLWLHRLAVRGPGLRPGDIIIRQTITS